MPETIVTSPDGKKYRVTHPEGASNDQIYQQLQSHLGQADPPADDGSARLSDIPRGGIKGVLGDVRGVAQMAPDWVKRGIRDIPGESSVESFAKAPSRSWLESGSEFAGAAAPFVAGELATGGAATIPGMLAEGALWSGLGAASQPTKEGTIGSHAIEGLEGAATAVPIAGAGRVIGATGRALANAPRSTVQHAAETWGRHLAAGAQEAGIHAAGIPITGFGGVPAWMLWRWLHHTPLSHLAGRWAGHLAPALQGAGRLTSGAGTVIEKAAPLAGVGEGQAQEPQDGE